MGGGGCRAQTVGAAPIRSINDEPQTVDNAHCTRNMLASY